MDGAVGRGGGQKGPPAENTMAEPNRDVPPGVDEALKLSYPRLASFDHVRMQWT